MSTQAQSANLRDRVVAKLTEIRQMLNPALDLRVTLLIHNVQNIEDSIMLTADTPEGIDEALAAVRAKKARLVS